MTVHIAGQLAFNLEAATHNGQAQPAEPTRDRVDNLDDLDFTGAAERLAAVDTERRDRLARPWKDEAPYVGERPGRCVCERPLMATDDHGDTRCHKCGRPPARDVG